jgi:2-hydroxycyclohexanecarboxyl-CoA dehydrogenase
MNFTGKTALITGGASGIGKATVMEFARCGARVICADVDAAKGADLVKEAGNLAVEFVAIDLADPVSVHRCAAEVLDRYGRVDILVNAAGWNDIQPFLDNAPDYMDRVLAVNLGGLLHLTQALLPAMVAASKGKIVNVSSDAGRVGSSGETAYAAAKGGVIAFTTSLVKSRAIPSTSIASVRVRPIRPCCSRGRKNSRKPSSALYRSGALPSRRKSPTRFCFSPARAPTTLPGRC